MSPATAATAPSTAADTPRPGRGARALRLLGRTATGLGALLLAGTAAASGWSGAPPPVRPVALAAAEVAVPAPGTTLVCPGPLRLPTEPDAGEDAAYDPQFDPAPEESVSRLVALTAEPPGARQAADAEVGGLAGTTAEALSGVPVGVRELVPGGATVVRAGPADDATAWLAGAVGVRTGSGDLRGTAASSCQEPAADLWLVGGSTSLGSSARLVVQNPGRTPATVELELWGPGGRVEPAGSPELLVPPGEERAVLLEGLAAEQERVVVHLHATGALVTAHLQDSLLRGLVGGGVDQVVAGAAPARRQVVPALSVPLTEVGGADPAVLRLLAPTEPGTASVTLQGADGPVDLPGLTDIALEAGGVLDVPLDGLPPGEYTAVVDADVPVVAGGLLTRGRSVGVLEPSEDDPLERAWVPAVRPGTAGPLALPSSAGVLDLALVPDPERPGPAAVEVTVVDGEGREVATHEVTLRSGRTTTYRLTDLVSGEALEALAADDPVAADGEAVADDATGDDADPATEGPLGVVVRSEDPRLVWGVVLVTPDPSGDLVSAVVPVPPTAAQGVLRVRVD